MARKKRKPPELDQDGYVHTGIYKRLVVKPPGRAPVEERKAWVDEMNEPVTATLARLRGELAAVILPYVDGALTVAELRSPPADGLRAYSFDLGEGIKIYREKLSLRREDQWVIDGFRNAVEAMDEIRIIEGHLGPDGQPTLLFLATLRLGQLCDRIQIRPFEPLAMTGSAVSSGGRDGAKETNADHVELHSLYQAKVDELMHHGAATGLSYNQAVPIVAKMFGVKSSTTVKNHTINRWPRPGGRPRRT